jgi:hypothetical protein
MQMKQRIMTTLALWLTIAVTGVWAGNMQDYQNAESTDNISDEVTLLDGTVVKSQKAPRRAPTDDYTYTYKGVKYTYITEHNYTRYFNTNIHKPEDYGWYTDKEGWFVNAEKAYITAASIDADNFPSSGEVYILNDLVGFFADHTHLGCIADNAFRYMSGVRRVYFQDCAAMSYTANSDFYFFIGDCAFADCENLEEVNLMQWTTSGDNHWEALPPTAVKRIWGSMLNNSPKAWLRVGTSVYQQYLGSQTWVQVRDRITTFEHASDDITVNGAVYSFLKAEDGMALSNADDQHEEIMKTLRLWNADYKEFNAASLLSDKSRTTDNANIWYTTVTGVDADYLKKNDGVMRIYNDPGSYYNYKTIAIRRGAFDGCDDLKAVEFWQTNGRSENSYSEPKMVIENGAFKGCKNLKEIRLFYKVEDGDDRWQVLGPKDLIPGNNILGLPTSDEIAVMDSAAVVNAWTVNPDFRILVASDRYAEFMEDPNWVNYIAYLQPADYTPTVKPDITKGGLTYGYIATGDGTYNTDQVVTQDFSLWSIPVIIAEVAMIVYSAYNILTAVKDVAAAKATLKIAQEGMEEAAEQATKTTLYQEATKSTSTFLGDLTKDTFDPTKFANFELFKPGVDVTKMGVLETNPLFGQMKLYGFINESGIFQDVTEQIFMSLNLAKDPLSTETVRLLKQYLMTFQMNASSLIYQSNKLATDAAYAALNNMITSKTGVSAAEQALNYSLIANPAFVGTTLGGNLATCNLLGASLNAASLKRGMQSNIIANMHQVSTHASNMIIITPDKNLIYHTFIKSAPDDIKDAVIYTGVSKVTRTTTFLPSVFQNKKQLRTVRFHDNSARTSHNMSANLIYIPDSAFVGCDALETLDLRLMTDKNGQRAMGPENFVLCGSDIFAGLDSLKFKIIIPNERREDFENDEMWSQYKRFFKFEDVEEYTNFTEFGVKYAFSYQNGNQYVEKLGGHTIEHLHAIGPDDDYIKYNNGALGFFNDIGSYNNYKLDYARKNAFRQNANVKSISFWDLAGWLWTGDAYTDLRMVLQDSCFAECPNLEYVDMLYLRTDGSNIAEPLTPTMLQVGNGVFDNSPKVRFKMTDRQTEKFAADSAWVKYQDRFLPCLFLPADPVVVSKLSDLKYRTDVARSWYDNNASKWGDWLDITRVTSGSYLNGKFSENSNLQSFPDFKRFELVGLTQVGGSWFQNCTNLSAIELPSTIKHIGGWAFYGCSKLKEITIPAAVETIDACAFQYSGLKTVRCEGTKPAKLEYSVFDLTSYNGFVIYVPAEAVDAYKQAWPSYAQYIMSNADNRKLTMVDVDQPGKLAEKLGLTMIMDGDRLRSVGGAYWKYDSLTVRGHLNGLDVGVLRHLMGADAWDSDPTDGRLRYLDLHDAHLDKDTKYSYNLWGVDEYLEKENWVGEYMFYKCNALETLILPASVTEIGENAFEEAKNLRQLFIGEKLERYTRDLIQGIPGGLEELVFMTDKHATSESDDPWEGLIKQVYTKNSQLGDYMSDPALTNRAQAINAPFEDDQVMIALKNHRFYFPSDYLNMETTMNPRGSYVDGNLYIFYRNNDIKYFDDFYLFSNIRELDLDFDNCTSLERITLPNSLEHIGYYAFRGCGKLGTIRINNDSVPELDRDALRDLPADFRIIVPKTHVKRYREKWEQYADHIVGEDEDFRSGIIEVTLTEPNTLAEKLGLKVTKEKRATYYGEDENDKEMDLYAITSVTGDYSHIRALKVNGPIGGADFTVMRFMAGYDIMRDQNNMTPFGGCRNYFGRLEYIDLYDADIRYSEYLTDALGWQMSVKFLRKGEDDVLPGFAFGRCYSLKTLILPKSMKRVKERAFQESEYLETLVVGDDCEEFNWSALDDCASITRMYILSRKKMQMENESWVWRNLCNNYSPTFDAFYVRPSLYNEYVADEAYTGSSQRTNNISSGAFKDDESFAAFAAHAAATEDDLRQISDISGWFRGHESAIDLNALQYTSIDSLRTADVAPLTSMKNITLPATIMGVGKDAFKNAIGLRYVDLSQCADYAPTLVAEGGVRSLGIGENTLVYVPAEYGESADVNVAVGDSTSGVFHTQTFRLVDGLDYCVPYAVAADNVENTRTLAKSPVPYTVCLPYALDIPNGAKVYRLSGRGSNELIFAQHTDRMEAMQPYLVWTENSDALLSTVSTTLPASTDGKTIGQQQQVLGYTLRGTLNSIGNTEAVELGAYVMNDDAKWHPVLSDTEAHKAVTIPAFRCFLLQSRYNNARTISMTLEDATGIEQLRTIDTDGTEHVYDLSGRCIDENTKGVVIKNGKKVINK